MQRTERQIHVCEYCGKTFKARKGARFCSNSCRVLAAKARKETKSVGTIAKEQPIKPQNLPVARTSVPVRTISQPERVITPEQAKAELKDFLIKAGLYITLAYIFDNERKPKRSRTRK